MRFFALIAGFLLITGIALAKHPFDGTWKGTTEGAMGATELTYVFKVDGKKITGSNSVAGQEAQLKDGKVIDDKNLSFTVEFDMGGTSMVFKVKGVLMEKNKMKISWVMEMPGGGDMGGGGGAGDAPPSEVVVTLQ